MTDPLPPPATDIDVDLPDLPPRQVRALLISLIIPRPIAWISTRSSEGIRNLAPHSYFTMVATDPAHIVVASSSVKDTLRNIRATGEFVVNLATNDLVEELNFSATDFPASEDEFSWTGLTAAQSQSVSAPRVAEAAAHMECVARAEVPVGGSFLIIAEVLHVHVAARVVSDGQVDPILLDPVTRLGGRSYATLGDVFDLDRPRWAEGVQGSQGDEMMPRRSRSTDVVAQPQFTRAICRTS